MKVTMAIIAAASLLALTPARAFNPQPDPPGFGMLGVNPGETLRLSIANQGTLNPDGFPPGPCRVELGFVDGQGNGVGTTLTQVLKPGASVHLDLDGNGITEGGVASARTLLRSEVRPVFRVASDTRFGLTPPDPCVVSAEIFDNETGETLVSVGIINPGVIHGFNPQPDPPAFGLIGLLPGQTARINLVNAGVGGSTRLPPGPCRAHLSFVDADGTVVASTDVTLKQGEAGFLDLPFALPTTDTLSDVAGRRVSVRPLLTFENKRGTPPDPCFPTLEVFDQASGKTKAFLNPFYRGRVQN